eukprot:gene29134-32352_t
MRYRSPIQDSIPRTPKLPGSVAVVFGSQDDLCIAEECRHIAEYMGCYVFKLNGASNVPGFNQLMGNLEAMRAAEVIIAVCGSDGSLPAIIADLVDVPVIAVPTSCGRNSILQGVGPLLGIMSSASPAVVMAVLADLVGITMAGMRLKHNAAGLRLKHNAAGMRLKHNAAVCLTPPWHHELSLSRLVVDVPVIAVPTSCGRNSILQGVGPLLGVMGSASPAVVMAVLADLVGITMAGMRQAETQCSRVSDPSLAS